MWFESSSLRTRFTIAWSLLLLVATGAAAQERKKISCPDGDHLEIDLKQISIQYDASSFGVTVSSLGFLGARLEVAPKQLQEAAAATQQWDLFLKGLATGYNNCAITRQQYDDGLKRIYPKLKEDGAGLEEIRKAISEGHKADEKRLQSLLDSYYASLREFARASGREDIIKHLEDLEELIRSGEGEILEQLKADTKKILVRIDELDKGNAQAPPSAQAEVTTEVSEIRKSLLAKTAEAEAAYNKGNDLLNSYRSREAIPYLQQAVAAAPLPDFYLALGRAYEGLPDLGEAEKALRAGLDLINGKNDDKHEAPLAVALGRVLQAKGDLEGARTYTQRALEILEATYGRDHPLTKNVAGSLKAIKQAMNK
jgi:tetratricopeptide (TPR) repeat protein